jgi:hypothetical protein
MDVPLLLTGNKYLMSYVCLVFLILMSYCHRYFLPGLGEKLKEILQYF